MIVVRSKKVLETPVGAILSRPVEAAQVPSALLICAVDTVLVPVLAAAMRTVPLLPKNPDPVIALSSARNSVIPPAPLKNPLPTLIDRLLPAFRLTCVVPKLLYAPTLSVLLPPVNVAVPTLASVPRPVIVPPVQLSWLLTTSVSEAGILNVAPSRFTVPLISLGLGAGPSSKLMVPPVK